MKITIFEIFWKVDFQQFFAQKSLYKSCVKWAKNEGSQNLNSFNTRIFKGGLPFSIMGFSNSVKKSNLQIPITFYKFKIPPIMYISTKNWLLILSDQLQDKVESDTRKWIWTHSGDNAFLCILTSHLCITCRFNNDTVVDMSLVLGNDFFGPLTCLWIPWM